MALVKELRRRTSLSQSKFAKTFNIPVRTLQQWEQNISSPPQYVLDMLEKQVKIYCAINESDKRHFIPKKTRWKICIDNPFKNCERIYPIQQRKVRELIDDISKKKDVNKIMIFGSSTTDACHIGSDVDIYVDSELSEGLVTRPHDFEFDLWTPSTVDKRLLQEIMSKGVTVYDQSQHLIR